MRFILISIFIIYYIGCSKEIKNKMQVIDVKSNGQFFNLEKMSLFNVGKKTRIIFKDNIEIYLSARVRFLKTNQIDINGEDIMKGDTSYIVYVITKGFKTGLKYSLDNFKTDKGVTFDFDSLKNGLGLTKENLGSLNLELGNPTEIIKGKITLEKFAIKKTSPTEPDSIYRYYDDSLNEVDFSFSRKLDNEHKKKLFKTSFIFNKITKGVALPNNEIPRRENVWQFSLINSENTKKYLEIIEKFKLDNENLKIN
jgi:hypothetical protein